MSRLTLCIGLFSVGLVLPATAHGQDLLAEGLSNATLSVKDIKGVWLPVKKGDIFRLTTGRLVFLAKNANSTEVIDKPDVLTAEVIVADAKREWKWTKESKTFEGSKPVPVVLPDATPAKASPADEARYQYYVACRLWDRLEAALQFGDEATVESIRKRASALAAHTRARPLNPNTTVLFDDLISDIQDFKRTSARRRELWKEFQEQAARLDQEARTRAAQAANEQMAGLMKLFVGGITSSSTDQYYSPSDNIIYSVTTVNEGSVRLAGEGLTDMMAAGARQSRNQSYFNSLKSGLKSDIARKLEALEGEQNSAWEARRSKTESFARRNFNIEPVGGVPDGKSLVRLMIERKDRQTLQKIVAE